MPIGNCFFVEEATTFEFRNGMFVVTVTVGGQSFDCVYTPHTFMVAHHRAQQAVDAFTAQDKDPIKLAG